MKTSHPKKIPSCATGGSREGGGGVTGRGQSTPYVTDEVLSVPPLPPGLSATPLFHRRVGCLFGDALA